MRRNTAYLPLAAALLLAASLPCSAQAVGAADRLRLDNMRLRAEVDSLRREVRSLRATAAADLWAGLTGLEEDDAYEDVTEGFGLGGKKVSAQLQERLDRCLPSVGLPWSETVSSYMDFYSGTKHAAMPAVLGRYDRYYPLFRDVFARYGVPDDLVALCVVESAVSVRALSRAGALGIWQFMPDTARDYGLRVDGLVDERMDVEKSTDAAARYLRDAYRALGSWGLAVMSYNCGVGAVKKAVILCGGSKDLWKIMERLPAETQGYLPSLAAARNVILHRDEFGITARTYRMPQTERIVLNMSASLDEIADAAGVPAKTVRDLNPKYVTGMLPAGENDVLLPKGDPDSIRNRN